MSDKEKKKMADSEAGPRPRRRGGIRAALFFLLLGVAIGVVITRGLPTRDSLERSWDQSRRWTRERLDGAREALDEPLSDAAREAEETWREVSKKTGETAREAAKSAEGRIGSKILYTLNRCRAPTSKNILYAQQICRSYAPLNI